MNGSKMIDTTGPNIIDSMKMILNSGIVLFFHKPMGWSISTNRRLRMVKTIMVIV